MQQDAVGARGPALAGRAAAGVPIAERLRTNRRRNLVESTIQFTLLLCAAISIVTTVGIVVVLFEETLAFYREVSLWDYLTNTQWIPRLGQFGVLPLVWGT